MNYSSLLNPVCAPVKTKIFGQDVYIRRISSDEQNGYIDATEDKSLNARELAILSVELVVSALVNPDGTKPAVDELPAAEALLAIHANGDVMSAVTAVQQHGWGTLQAVEDTEKN